MVWFPRDEYINVWVIMKLTLSASLVTNSLKPVSKKGIAKLLGTNIYYPYMGVIRLCKCCLSVFICALYSLDRVTQ